MTSDLYARFLDCRRRGLRRLETMRDLGITADQWALLRAAERAGKARRT